jgi:IrrE N-terminal-like domain
MRYPVTAFNTQDVQESLFENSSPAAEWDRDITRRALDELFRLAGEYKTTKEYRELLDFVVRFRFYSPYNAMLVHIQMSGAKYVAPPHRWLGKYRRRTKAGARPIVILQPMGPVMFVYDVSDTEPEEGAPPLPLEVVNPFKIRQGQIRGELGRTIENAKRDGVLVAEREGGSQSAGAIRCAQPGQSLVFLVKEKPEPECIYVPRRYELLLNSKHPAPEKYATLAHELGHLYCGHLGTPNDKWWPDRRGLSDELCELEAESVCYLVCSRLGIDNPSAEYLSSYIENHQNTPTISVECVMKSAWLIEQMGRGRLTPRKEKA